MYVLIVGIIIVLVVVVVCAGAGTASSLSRATTTHRGAHGMTEEEKTVEQNRQWLAERWARADEERASGDLISAPNWFFDDVTEAQLRRLEETGVEITKGRPTKGQASDLIGLFEPVEPECEEILRFFKVSRRGMNQSRARHEVGRLLADPESRNTWANRPATAMELEFYRFIGEKPPKGVTHMEAASFQSKHVDALPDDHRLLDEWESYESIWDELSDRDLREDYEIKSVSLSLFRKAVGELRQEGKTLSELAANIDVVVDRIVELKPDIRKA